MVGPEMHSSPRSPMGSSFSVSGSKTETSVLTSGMPTLPSLLFLPAAQVAAEETSVMP